MPFPAAGWEQMTKDQKADAGGDPWESRRPLIHCWAPGQGHSTCELPWKTLPAWSPLERLSHWHLSAGARSNSGCAQQVRLSGLLEMACSREVQTGNPCRRVGSRVPGVGIAHPAPAPSLPPWVKAALVPSSLGQEQPLLGPSLALCHPSAPAPSCCPPGKLGFRGWSRGKWRCLFWDVVGAGLRWLWLWWGSVHMYVWVWGFPFRALGTPAPHMLCVYVPLCLSGVILVTALSVR